MAFLAAENENRQLEDSPQADFGRVPKRFLLSVRTKSIVNNWEFCVSKITPIVCFCSVSTLFSSCQRQRTLRFLFGDCRSFYFRSLMKLTFLVGKGLLCLYDKQNNTWLLVDTKFLCKEVYKHQLRNSLRRPIYLNNSSDKTNYLVIYSTKAALPVALKRLTAWMKLSLLLTLG